MKFYYYSIINTVNNKKYIGITERIQKRKQEHFKKLQSNKHGNYKLQSDWNLYGEENFIFSIIEEKDFDNENLGYEYERFLIEKENSINNGYNIAIGGLVNPMYTDSIKEKMTKTKQSQVPNIFQLEEIEENVFKVRNKFNSQKEAQRNGFSQRNISKAIKERVKGDGFYWVEEKDILSTLSNWEPKRSFMNPVAELDSDNNITQVYSDCGKAAHAHNWYKNNVSAAIQRNGKAGGIKFIKISKEDYFKYKPITLIF